MQEISLPLAEADKDRRGRILQILSADSEGEVYVPLTTADVEEVVEYAEIDDGDTIFESSCSRVFPFLSKPKAEWK